MYDFWAQNLQPWCLVLHGPHRQSTAGATVIAACVVALSYGCGGDSTAPTPPPPVSVAAVDIAQDSTFLTVGTSAQLSAAVKDASGTALSGRVVAWSVSDTILASVTSSGSVSARARGLVWVRASSEGVRDSAKLVVSAASVGAATAGGLDTIRVAAGLSATILIPPGGLPTGTTVRAEELSPSVDTTQGRPVGPVLRLSVGLSSGSGSIRMARRASSEGNDFTTGMVAVLSVVAAYPLAAGHRLIARLRNVVASDPVHTYHVIPDDVSTSVDPFGQTHVDVTVRIPGPPLGSTAGTTDFAVDLIDVLTVCPQAQTVLYTPGNRTTPPTQASPNRIPLVLVHGWQPFQLFCNAAASFWPEDAGKTWSDVISGITQNAVVSARYEVWLFRYPTIQSVVVSADGLRDAIAQRFPSRDIVIVAHSMGGLVASRYILHDATNHVAGLISLGTPFSGTQLADHDYADLRENLAFSSCLSDVGYFLDWIARGLILGSDGARDLSPSAPPVQDIMSNLATIGPRLTAIAGDISRGSQRTNELYARMHCVLAALGSNNSDGVVPLNSAYPAAAASRTQIDGYDHGYLTEGSTAVSAVMARLEDLATQVPSSASSIVAESGDKQLGAPNSALAQPLVVRVTDASGVGVPGVTVAFAAVAGGGSVTPTTATTDAQGRAQASWTLGASGAQNATATASAVPSNPSVTFAAIVAPDIASLCSVSSDGSQFACTTGTPGPGYIGLVKGTFPTSFAHGAFPLCGTSGTYGSAGFVAAPFAEFFAVNGGPGCDASNQDYWVAFFASTAGPYDSDHVLAYVQLRRDAAGAWRTGGGSEVVFEASHGVSGSTGAFVSLTGVNISGTDRLLVCEVAIEPYDSPLGVSSVTVDDGLGGGAQSMVQLGTYYAAPPDGLKWSTWYLTGATLGGSRRVVATVTSASAKPLALACVSYSGADQTSPFGAVNVVTGTSGSTAALTIASDRDGSLPWAHLFSSNSGYAAGVGVTNRQRSVAAGGEFSYLVDGGNSRTSPGANHTFTWTYACCTGTFGGQGAMIRRSVP